MEMNINREWLIRMAEKEANGIVSVGGFWYKQMICDLCGSNTNNITSIIIYVRYKETNNADRSEFDLCDECAERLSPNSLFQSFKRQIYGETKQ